MKKLTADEEAQAQELAAKVAKADANTDEVVRLLERQRSEDFELNWLTIATLQVYFERWGARCNQPEWYQLMLGLARKRIS